MTTADLTPRELGDALLVAPRITADMVRGKTPRDFGWTNLFHAPPGWLPTSLNDTRLEVLWEQIRRHNSRRLFRAAVARGDLARPACCERCGRAASGRQMHGHHVDYTKPLVVEWLCNLCHRAAHASRSRSP